MDIRSLPAIIAFTLNVILGLIVLSNNPKNTSNRLFTLFALSFAIWNIGEFITINSPSQAIALLGRRVLLAGFFMASVFFLHFTHVFPRKSSALFDRLRNRLVFYLMPVFALVVSLPQLQLESGSQRGWKYVFYYTLHPQQPLSFHIPYLALVVLCVFYVAWGMKNLFASLGTTLLAREKLQVKYLIFGITLMGVVAAGIDLANHFLNWGLPLFALSCLYSLLVSLFFAIAIIKYRPLDIHELIKGGILYSSLSAMVLVIYVLVVKNLGELIGGATRAHSILAESLFIIALVLLSRPLKGKVERVIDRFFYRGRYEYQEKFRQFSEALIDITDVMELLKAIAGFITQAFHTRRAAIFLLDQDVDQFVPRWRKKVKVEVRFDRQGDLVRSLRDSKGPLEFEDLKERIESGPDFSRDPENRDNDIDQLAKINASMIIPMMVKDELVAIFILGEKSLKKDWTVEDIELLTIFSNQASVAISRALMYQEVKAKERELMRSEKLAALGELSAGIAHEIRNPLGIISASAETIKKREDQETKEEVTQFIIDEVNRLDGLLANFLDFAKPQKPNLVECDLLGIAENTLELISKKASDCSIEIEREYDQGLSAVLIDPVQVKQILINLELNAIEAMKDGGVLKIGIRKDGNKGVTIKISDTGNGIAPEIRSRIYDPFFTTKENGTGLGLSIVHRIVESCGGTISLTSNQGRGTTFAITLPLNRK